MFITAHQNCLHTLYNLCNFYQITVYFEYFKVAQHSHGFVDDANSGNIGSRPELKLKTGISCKGMQNTELTRKNNPCGVILGGWGYFLRVKGGSPPVIVAKETSTATEKPRASEAEKDAEKEAEASTATDTATATATGTATATATATATTR